MHCGDVEFIVLHPKAGFMVVCQLYPKMELMHVQYQELYPE